MPYLLLPIQGAQSWGSWVGMDQEQGCPLGLLGLLPTA